jgi:hypothetical protein
MEAGVPRHQDGYNLWVFSCEMEDGSLDLLGILCNQGIQADIGPGRQGHRTQRLRRFSNRADVLGHGNPPGIAFACDESRLFEAL